MAEFGAHCVVTGFPELAAVVQATVNSFYDAGDVPNAERILGAYVELVDGLNALAVKTAARATERFRESLTDELERPVGDQTLHDAIECEPVIEFGIPGLVGLVNYDKLKSEAPWWPVQEWGSEHNVGRLIFGAFHTPGGDTRPDPTMDKQHAFFEARGKGEGVRGSMVIHKEIKAKHFLESVAHLVEAEWLVQFRALEAECARKMSVLL